MVRIYSHEVWGRNRHGRWRNEYCGLVNRNNIQLRMLQKVRALNKRKVYQQILVPFSRQLSTNQHYSDLAGGITIEERVGMGRCVIATANISPCIKIGEATAFVSSADRSEIPYCLTCHSTTNKLILCEDCEIVAFCDNNNCSNHNKTHQYECGTDFQTINFGEKMEIKCAIEMVLKSLSICDDNIEDLTTEVQRILQSPHAVPAAINSDETRFEAIMRLTGHVSENTGSDLLDAFNIIMTLPRVRRHVENRRNQHHRNFLQHLLAHFLTILVRNSFRTELTFKNYKVDVCTVFDTFSHFNHSCSPNGIISMKGTKMYITSSRLISVDEEICISYRFFDVEVSTAQRQQILRDWGFICACVRCVSAEPITQDQINQIQRPIKRKKKAAYFSELEKKLKSNCNSRIWTTMIGAYGIVYEEALMQRI